MLHREHRGVYHYPDAGFSGSGTEGMVRNEIPREGTGDDLWPFHQGAGFVRDIDIDAYEGAVRDVALQALPFTREHPSGDESHLFHLLLLIRGCLVVILAGVADDHGGEEVAVVEILEC